MVETGHAGVPPAASPPLGPGTVTLIEGADFCISDGAGDVLPGHPHGFFSRDTRLISELRLLVDGDAVEPLAARALEPFHAVFVLRPPPAPGRADSPLLVVRHRYLGQGMREDVSVRNYSDADTRVEVTVVIGVDFADLFEVKEGRVAERAVPGPTVGVAGLVFAYETEGFQRALHVSFSHRPARAEDGRVAFDARVPARGEWSLCVQCSPEFDREPARPRYQCGQPIEGAAPARRLATWRRELVRLETPHEPLRQLFHRSAEDLAALRLFDPALPDRVVIAAGAPWFMTVFGRDSLLASWMALLLGGDLASGTLAELARTQGRRRDPRSEEEPGRIVHEIRVGEAARRSLHGGAAYYGSVDATPLFVMLLGELRRWGREGSDIEALAPNAERALAWIDEFGDRDGDGYVEYQRATPRGLKHQGWKDSWDGIRFADGRLAEPPVALCEVQGYVYAALLAGAELAAARGAGEDADRLRRRAGELRARFNRDFWIAERGWLALGLDRDKQPIDALASNMGHCLWAGILDDEKAAVVAERLVSGDLDSGWGVRTLGRSMHGYNPVSYQCGSVWPHDTAICVAGLMRYGHVEAAHRLARGLIDAASHFGNRLPELFAGLDRAEYPFPVGYPTSCSPQAWAAAAPLLVLRALLRLDPDVPAGRIRLAPALPEWIGHIRLEGVPIGGGVLSFEAAGDDLELLEVPAGVHVAAAAR